MKLIKKAQDTHISNMKDGDIGIITSWEDCTRIGLVVQRHGNNLVVLGDTQKPTHLDYFRRVFIVKNNLVEILKKGDMIEL